MIKLLPILLFILFTTQSEAQKFGSFTSAGIVAGESAPALEIQTVNGLQWQRFFVGAGIGKDNYVYKTLPVFADLKIFIDGDKKAFLYGDLGYDFVLKNTPKTNVFNYDDNKFSGGLYTAFGVGTEFKFINKSKIFMAFGHTYKVVKIKNSFNGDCAYCGEYEENIYKLGRISFKAGISW